MDELPVINLIISFRIFLVAGFDVQPAILDICQVKGSTRSFSVSSKRFSTCPIITQSSPCISSIFLPKNSKSNIAQGEMPTWGTAMIAGPVSTLELCKYLRQ
jgi:hypothetical protein